jgi:hypothetical protein
MVRDGRARSQPFGNAWSSVDLSADFVSRFRRVVSWRRTRMVNRGSMVVTALPIKVRLSKISELRQRVPTIMKRPIIAEASSCEQGARSGHFFYTAPPQARLCMCRTGAVAIGRS